MKFSLTASALIIVSAFSACGKSESSPRAAAAATASASASPQAGEIRPSGVMLTPKGFKCAISSSGLPDPVKIGTPAKISVKVDNQSSENWSRYNNKNSPQFSVNLGVRWYAPGSDQPVKDSQRVPLAEDVPPGGSATLNFPIEPPGKGTYQVRFELIQEGLGWFSEKGGCKTESNISVK